MTACNGVNACRNMPDPQHLPHRISYRNCGGNRPECASDCQVLEVQEVCSSFHTACTPCVSALIEKRYQPLYPCTYVMLQFCFSFFHNCNQERSQVRRLCCSAFGLSAAALATEVSCYACTVAYGVRKGYAATLWGSELACWGQDMTLLGLVAVLRGVRLPVMGAIGLGMLALKSFLFTEIVPLWFLSKMQVRSYIHFYLCSVETE